MPEEYSFDTTHDQPIVPKPKRRAPRKRTTTPKPKSEGDENKARVSQDEEEKIKKFLTTVYRDDNGSLPNMREIRIKKSSPVLKFLSTILGVGAILAAIAWLGYFYLPHPTSTTDTTIDLTLSGPTEVTQGATTTYTVTYKNNTGEPIDNVTLNIYYPTGFVYNQSSVIPQNPGHSEWTLGPLTAHEERTLTITGFDYGTLGSKHSWRAFINYRPHNVNSDLQHIATLETVVKNSPFSLSVTGPDQVFTGNDAEYTLKVNNSDAAWPAVLYIVPTFPDGFSISSSTQPLDKNKRWLVKLTSSTGTPPVALPIKIRGTFATSSAEAPTMHASLQLPLPEDQVTELTTSDLKLNLTKSDVALSMAVNGAITNANTFPGDTLNITLRLKNASNADIKNSSVQIVFDAPSSKKQSILKWSDFKDDNDGDVKGEQISDTVRRGTVVWNGKTIPALAKIKASGEVLIDIQIPIKGVNDFDVGDIKDPSIVITASASYTDKNNSTASLSANPITLTLTSDTTLDVRDTVSGSDHAVSWVLNNNFHALKNIEISATAFGDISFNADTKPDAGELTYNSKDKKITWKIASMPDSVDVLNAPFTLTLNKNNPTQNTLVSKPHVTAEDSVTGKTLDFYGNEITLNQ